MKVIVKPEFLFSYYYHAAKNASSKVLKKQLPHSFYDALTSLILWQCVLESYANYQIQLHHVQEFEFTRRNGDLARLGSASIKEKWLHLPTARGKPPFTPNKREFRSFASLVDLRNTFVHFRAEVLAFHKEAPPGMQTMGDLISWSQTGEFLSGSIYEAAVQCAVDGEAIVRDVFDEYSRLTGDALPKFLNGTELVEYKDGIGILQINPFVSFKVLFQCKRYSGSVTRSQIGDFRNSMLGRADKGIIITTGSFTADARMEAGRDGAPPIELVDGQKLVEMFESLELGLTPKKTYEVDDKFFEEFRIPATAKA